VAKRINEQMEPPASVLRRYPWDEWTDGSTWIATPNEDFTCKVSSFRAALYDYATRGNMRVHSTVLDSGEVKFQFFSEAGNEKVAEVPAPKQQDPDPTRSYRLQLARRELAKRRGELT